MVHWYHLAVAIGKGPTNSTWDGSACDGTVSFPDLGRDPFNGSAPVILYGPACGKPVAGVVDTGLRTRSRTGVGDAPRVEVALPQDANDPYLTTWEKTQPGPVVFEGTPCSFPGRVWRSKIGPYWNMLCSFNGTGCWARYTSSDPRLMRWKLADKSFVRNGHAPYCDAGAMFHRLPGSPLSGGGPTHVINANTGSAFQFGRYDEQNETMVVMGTTVIDSSVAYQWAAAGRNGPDPMTDTGRLLTVAWLSWQGWPGWDGYRTAAISLPREIRWDAPAKQLSSFPVEETALLRNTTFLRPTALGDVPNGGRLITLPIPFGRGGAVDISLSIEVPHGASGGLGIAARAPQGTTQGAALTLQLQRITTPDPSTGVRMVTASFTPLQTAPLVSGTSKPANVTFLLLKGELLEIRLIVDRPIVELFLMSGRAAFTSTDENFRLDATSTHVFDEGSGGGFMIRNASAYGMGCGWAKARPQPVVAY